MSTPGHRAWMQCCQSTPAHERKRRVRRNSGGPEAIAPQPPLVQPTTTARICCPRRRPCHLQITTPHDPTHHCMPTYKLWTLDSDGPPAVPQKYPAHYFCSLLSTTAPHTLCLCKTPVGAHTTLSQTKSTAPKCCPHIQSSHHSHKESPAASNSHQPLFF